MRAFIALQLLIALSVRVPKDFSCVSVSVVIVSKNGKQIIGVHPEFEFILDHSLSNVLNQCLSQMLPLQGLMSPVPKNFCSSSRIDEISLSPMWKDVAVGVPPEMENDLHFDGLSFIHIDVI